MNKTSIFSTIAFLGILGIALTSFLLISHSRKSDSTISKNLFQIGYEYMSIEENNAATGTDDTKKLNELGDELSDMNNQNGGQWSKADWSFITDIGSSRDEYEQLISERNIPLPKITKKSSEGDIEQAQQITQYKNDAEAKFQQYFNKMKEKYGI
jgi:hypothetical protein